MKKILIFAVVLSLLAPAAAFADTEFSLGGFIKLDSYWDSTQAGKNMNWSPLAATTILPIHHGNLRFTAQGSRINFTIKGPEVLGPSSRLHRNGLRLMHRRGQRIIPTGTRPRPTITTFAERHVPLELARGNRTDVWPVLVHVLRLVHESRKTGPSRSPACPPPGSPRSGSPRGSWATGMWPVWWAGPNEEFYGSPWLTPLVLPLNPYEYFHHPGRRCRNAPDPGAIQVRPRLVGPGRLLRPSYALHRLGYRRLASGILAESICCGEIRSGAFCNAASYATYIFQSLDGAGLPVHPGHPDPQRQSGRDRPPPYPAVDRPSRGHFGMTGDSTGVFKLP